MAIFVAVVAELVVFQDKLGQEFRQETCTAVTQDRSILLGPMRHDGDSRAFFDCRFKHQRSRLINRKCLISKLDNKISHSPVWVNIRFIVKRYFFN